ERAAARLACAAGVARPGARKRRPGRERRSPTLARPSAGPAAHPADAATACAAQALPLAALPRQPAALDVLADQGGGPAAEGAGGGAGGQPADGDRRGAESAVPALRATAGGDRPGGAPTPNAVICRGRSVLPSLGLR